MATKVSAAILTQLNVPTDHFATQMHSASSARGLSTICANAKLDGLEMEKFVELTVIWMDFVTLILCAKIEDVELYA